MKTHPIAAAVAFTVMVSGIVALAVTKLSERADGGHASSPPEKQLNQALRAAVQHGMEGRLDRAEAELSALAEAHPEDALVWLNYGVALSGREKYEAAEDAFQRVLKLEPEAWAAHAELATIYLLTERLDAAVEQLKMVPSGEGRVAERLHRDPVWLGVDDPRVDELRSKHAEVPETSLHVDDVTAKPR